MNKTSYSSFFFLFIFLFLLLSFPVSFCDSMRSIVVGSFVFCSHPLSFLKSNTKDSELLQLRLENRLLHEKLEEMHQWVFCQNSKEQLAEKCVESSEKMKHLLDLHLQSFPAKVIFRAPISWSSSIWINVGEKHNKKLGKRVIAKNSPVVFGDFLVGVVEYVGNDRSRVRLITDSGMVPSVRAVRGEYQEQWIISLARLLYKQIERGDNLSFSDAEKETLSSLFLRVQEKLSRGDSSHLAKGVLEGKSAPLWRANRYLRGVGFNYDFSDEEGLSRDIRTGKVLEDLSSSSLPIIQKEDLLITTGLDGIFPAGLTAGIVSKVYPLKRGDYCYQIDAECVIPHFDEMTIVFVLPPIAEEFHPPLMMGH